MNLKDCYIKFGGDFDEVLGRLRREQIVQKFKIIHFNSPCKIFVSSMIHFTNLVRMRELKSSP
jgi:hypothetical protein